MSFLPLAAVAVVPGAALRGPGEPTNQPADRGALAGVAAEQPGDQRAAGGACRGAAQRSAIGRAGTVARPWTVTLPWTVTWRTIAGRPIAWPAVSRRPVLCR